MTDFEEARLVADTYACRGGTSGMVLGTLEGTCVLLVDTMVDVVCIGGIQGLCTMWVVECVSWESVFWVGVYKASVVCSMRVSFAYYL